MPTRLAIRAPCDPVAERDRVRAGCRDVANRAMERFPEFRTDIWIALAGMRNHWWGAREPPDTAWAAAVTLCSIGHPINGIALHKLQQRTPRYASAATELDVGQVSSFHQCVDRRTADIKEAFCLAYARQALGPLFLFCDHLFS